MFQTITDGFLLLFPTHLRSYYAAAAVFLTTVEKKGIYFKLLYNSLILNQQHIASYRIVHKEI